MADDLSRSPSVRMSEDLDRRLRVAAAHEGISKTVLIRRILRGAIGEVENEGLAEFLSVVDETEAEAVEAD